MADTKIVEAKAIQAKDIKQPDWSSIPSCYANSANLVVTNWDFRLLLGEVMPDSQGGLSISPRASIVMSPQHTKAFLAILNTYMADYEREHGEIKWEQPAQAK